MGSRMQPLIHTLMGLALLAAVAGLAAGRAEATASFGACCRANLECAVTDQFSCDESGGTYFGDGTTCAEIPCDQHVAVPVFSLLGLVGVTGALMGLALFRLIRRRDGSVPGTA